MNDKFDWDAALRGDVSPDQQQTFQPPPPMGTPPYQPPTGTQQPQQPNYQNPMGYQQPQQPPYQQPYQAPYRQPNDFGRPVYNIPEIKHASTKAGMEKKTLRAIGTYCGLAVILFFAFQVGLSVILELFGLLKNYESDLTYQGAVDLFLTIVGLFLPFVICGKQMEKQSKSSHLYWDNRSTMNFGKPKGALNFFLALIAGLGICMVANLVTTLVSIVVSLFGYESASLDSTYPTDLLGIFITFLRISLIAGLTEEIALRGYTMGSLRIYGDKTAILFSSVVFGLMHGNLIQIPFAMVAGFALGYFTVKTRSMWTGIIIHAVNNFISVFFSYLMQEYSEDVANMAYNVIFYGLIAAGIVALILFVRRTGDIRLASDRSELSFKQKVFAFFVNPAMIIALIILMVETALYLEKVAA